MLSSEERLFPQPARIKERMRKDRKLEEEMMKLEGCRNNVALGFT
jgi:hypothetical protein